MEQKELLDLFLSSTGVSIDSRNIASGNIFFAIVGERFDGHNYIDEVMQKGALAAVVSKDMNLNYPNIIVVEDTMLALQDLARDYRDLLNIPVISLTGSNGKTTTKELLHLILNKKFNTFATVGNLNNHLGVPLSLLSLQPSHEIAIIEMGANHRYEIAELVKIAKPDVGLITNIGHAHLEGFGSREGIAMGKFELFDFLMEKACPIIFRKDSYKLSELVNTYPQAIVIDQSSVVIHGDLLDISDIVIQPTIAFTIAWKGKEYLVRSHLYGAHNFENIVMAIVVGLFYKVLPEDIVHAIAQYLPLNNRSQIVQLGDSTIYLDAYNANPDSMKAAIHSFSMYASASSLIVLGEMKELGEYTQLKHQELIDLMEHVFQDKMPALWLFGESWKTCKLPIGSTHFSDFTLLKERWSAENKQFNRILIKGSRSNKLESLLA